MTLGAAGSQYIFVEWKTKWTSIWIDEAAGNFFLFLHFCIYFAEKQEKKK